LIVRINQIDPDQFEGDPGPSAWSSDGPTGRIQIEWSPRAYEVLILDTDEQQKPVGDSFRQKQLRKMIPLATAALIERGQVLVLRLDGPVAPGELMSALGHLAGGAGGDVRYACSEFQKLHTTDVASSASLRVAASPVLANILCGDENIGLSRSVRLRAMAVPPDLVAPLLDVSATDDERWQEILPHSPFLLSTTPQLRSLRILSCSIEPAEMKSRITRQLFEVARGTTARAV
jgi:hypothetical protein